MSGKAKATPNVKREIREAIELRIEGMREDGDQIPPPSSSLQYIEIAA
jgi:predicted RNase H-like HicB family nuclease